MLCRETNICLKFSYTWFFMYLPRMWYEHKDALSHLCETPLSGSVLYWITQQRGFLPIQTQRSNIQYSENSVYNEIIYSYLIRAIISNINGNLGSRVLH